MCWAAACRYLFPGFGNSFTLDVFLCRFSLTTTQRRSISFFAQWETRKKGEGLPVNPLKKAIFVSVGCLCVVLGICGAFLPVLPTTPLLLAAAFLFSRSSQRLNDWLVKTKVYKTYVEPINAGDGIPLRKKASILGVSYAVMAVSAIAVARPLVWAILGCVAVFLFWLIGFRVPTAPATETE